MMRLVPSFSSAVYREFFASQVRTRRAALGNYGGSARNFAITLRSTRRPGSCSAREAVRGIHYSYLICG